MSATETVEKTRREAESKGQPPDIHLAAALKCALRTDSAAIKAHLVLLQRDIIIAGTQTLLHCYFLPVDGNGRVRVKPLAEFLRDQIVDYAIPRKTIEEAMCQTASNR